MSKPGQNKLLKKKRREAMLKKRRHVKLEQERIGDLYFEAESYAEEELWPEAIRCCKSILAAAPNHTSTLRLLAHACHQTADAAEEALVLRRLTDLKPDEKGPAWNLMVAEHASGHLESAMTCAKELSRRFSLSSREKRDLKNILEYLTAALSRTSPAAWRPPTGPAVAGTAASNAENVTEKTAASPGAAAPVTPPATDLTQDIPVIKKSIGMAAGKAFCQPVSVEPDSLHWLRQRLRYAHLRLQNEFDELICIPALNGVLHFAYQAETVRKVLKSFRGRVLLSDEVGLGKTVEAGMVVKEYLLRGMIKTVLVLCPPSLVHQWNKELRDKFGIRGQAQSGQFLVKNADAFWSYDIVIASINTAKNRSNSARVLEKSWDMVVVDEAHHLRNRKTLAWELVNSIRKKFILLLSATPVQNDLVELYNLITLLKPGAFPPEKEFLRTYADPKNPRAPRNADQLRLLMRDCMIRNTRAGCGVPFPKRFASTLSVRFTDEEREVYEQICDTAGALLKGGQPPRLRLAVRTVLERAGAHLPLATGALRTLAAVARGEQNGQDEAIIGRLDALVEKTASLSSTGKMDTLTALLGEHAMPCIVFCRHTATVHHVCGGLLTAGIPYAAFHGGMGKEERVVSIESLRDGEGRVLVSSESGGEGHNLQFCNAIVNFDLPWNPMQIEQRIGRIHRIGQDRDVFVFNLCYQGTLEEKILGILSDKIRMFELVVGEVDSILGANDDRGDFSEVVMDLWLNSGSADGRTRALDELGASLASSRDAYLDSCRLDEQIFGKEMEA
jgi:superfamily II DNA or RNA helicase